MAETFRWRAMSDVKTTHKFNVCPVQFDGGYKQRQLRSLRPKLRNWGIKVIGQKTLIGEIKTFFGVHGGVEPLNQWPPGGGTALVKVSEYTEMSKGGKMHELGCTSEEVLI